MPEILGMVGMVVAIAAYMPQIVILIRSGSSADLSLRSWQLFFMANLMLVTSAMQGDDLLFKLSSLTNLTLVALTMVLIMVYRRGVPKRPFAILAAGVTWGAGRLYERARSFVRRGRVVVAEPDWTLKE